MKGANNVRKETEEEGGADALHPIIWSRSPEAPLLKPWPSLVSGLSLLLESALRGYGRRGERASKRERDRDWIVSRQKATRHDEPRDCFRVLTGVEWGSGTAGLRLQTALGLLQR